MSSDFTPEQKRYLEGFVAGIQARGGTAFVSPGNAPQAVPEPKPMGPDAPHLIAQDETIKAGKKLADQEKWKREEHPFDAYHKLCGQRATNIRKRPIIFAGGITVSSMSRPPKMCSTAMRARRAASTAFLPKLRSNSGARRARRRKIHPADIGAHPQKQSGLFYLGVVLPVGKMSCSQMRALASIGRDIGDGDIRLNGLAESLNLRHS